MLDIKHPYLLFLGDAPDQLAAKTANGVKVWRPEWCVGQLRLAGCKADLGIPDVTLEEAVAKGAKTMILGVANRGGTFGADWQATMIKALELGLDLASGLHSKITDLPVVVETAAKHGRQLFDVRHPTETFPIGTGDKRPGLRLLTVGTDCSLGKMFTALALEREMKARGMKVSFRATGQTGIFIAGSGLSVDAVVSDFISGAIETLCPANDPDHWDVVEGQASVLHPSYAGVTTGLVHGSQPDAMVMCHEPGRPHMRGLPGRPMPDIADCIAAHETVARLTNPAAKVIGFSVNTASLDEGEADAFLKGLEDRYGLPASDPVRKGVSNIIDRVQQEWPQAQATAAS